MPIKLITSGGGSAILTPTSKATDYTLTVPAVTANVITSADSNTVTTGMIAPNVAGQILSSTGSTTAWVNGWVPINTINVSAGAAIQDTTSFTSTYANYLIVIRKLLPATNAVDVKFQIYSGGAYQTTNYSTVLGYGYAGGASGFQGTTYLPLSYSLRASNVYQSSGMLHINNVNSTTEYKPFHGTATHYDTGTGYYWSDILGGAWIGGTGAITGFQIVASSGNITGIVQVYGSS